MKRSTQVNYVFGIGITILLVMNHMTAVAQVSSANLELKYSFEEEDGIDVVDTSPVDREGQRNNGWLWANPTRTIRGKVGRGLHFDNDRAGYDDDMVKLYASPLGVRQQDNLTIAIWFFINDKDYEIPQVLTERGGGEMGWSIVVAGGKLFFSMWNIHCETWPNHGGTSITTDEIENGRWHHAVMTLKHEEGTKADPKGMQAYLDGRPVGSGWGGEIAGAGPGIGYGAQYNEAKMVGPGKNPTNTEAHLGHRPGDHGMGGFIDEARVYTRALTAAEVKALYDLENGRTDIEPPSTPRGLQATDATSATVDLSWDASADNEAIGGYDILDQEGVVRGSTIGPSTQLRIRGLPNGKTYELRVRAMDLATNVSELSEPITVETPPIKDVSPPTAPTNLRALHVTRKTMYLYWDPSTDDVGVTSYEVFVNGDLAGRVEIRTRWEIQEHELPNRFFLKDLKPAERWDESIRQELRPGTTYTIHMIAKDASGKESAKSKPLIIATSATAEILSLLKKSKCSGMGGRVYGYHGYAFDGIIAKRAITHPLKEDAWIYVDLGEVKDFDKIVLLWDKHAFAAKYTMETSDDLEDWTVIHTDNNADGGDDVLKLRGKARYVRMHGTKFGDMANRGYGLYEFGVYASGETER